MDLKQHKQRSEYFAPWRTNDFAPEHSTFGKWRFWGKTEIMLKTLLYQGLWAVFVLPKNKIWEGLFSPNPFFGDFFMLNRGYRRWPSA